jgi:beta-lactamase superfamily II metal-dependent hydrolase
MRKYVSEDTTRLYVAATGSDARQQLLWGDGCEVLEEDGDRTKVRARGSTGWVDTDALGDEQLLELYFIDVGQGDGVLIRTPGGRHVLVDGGYKRAGQPTGKNAADFVDWKFATDYGADRIHIDAMIASHCDADHYGGLWDLVNPNETFDLDLDVVEVDAFFHAGVSWWRDPGHSKWTGPKADGFLERLLGDRDDVGAHLGDGPGTLQGEWGDFLAVVHALGCPITRLSHLTGLLPGFGPEHPDGVTIRVLGPVEHPGAQPGDPPRVRSFGSTGKDSNGNSIVLRVDYDDVRILLTGDLNLAAQQALLADSPGVRQELACDVTKGCHHGSDDCSYEFLQVAGAACTVISSGDNESHAHPRPTIVAASGLAGFERISKDKVHTPLVYSTEISRSVRIGKPFKVKATTQGPDGPVVHELWPEDIELVYRETRAGDLKPTTATRRLDRLKVVPGIVYGLVNVRTDGRKILCATRNEKNGTWDTHTLTSRF